MTPYATLLVKPTDGDETIRKAYHVLAKQNHPDGAGWSGEPNAAWYATTAAYTAIKTFEARAAWKRQSDLLAGQCASCAGVGVLGTRMFKGKLRICMTCKGEGIV